MTELFGTFYTIPLLYQLTLYRPMTPYGVMARRLSYDQWRHMASWRTTPILAALAWWGLTSKLFPVYNDIHNSFLHIFMYNSIYVAIHKIRVITWWISAIEALAYLLYVRSLSNSRCLLRFSSCKQRLNGIKRQLLDSPWRFRLHANTKVAPFSSYIAIIQRWKNHAIIAQSCRLGVTLRVLRNGR